MFKIELTLKAKLGDIIDLSIEGEDIAFLKNSVNSAIICALKEHNISHGYFDVEMVISENGNYFDSEPATFIYFDGENINLASSIDLTIFGRSNLSNIAIDYIEVELTNGSVTTLDWDTSYWDRDETSGTFCVELPFISTTDGSFVDGDTLKNIKCVSSIQVYSDTMAVSPTFSIDEIGISEDGTFIGKICDPEIKDVFYEF